jgi:hypothetical protein
LQPAREVNAVVRPPEAFMERWTLTQSFSGRYRLHIQFGGRPFWCMFDYAAAPEPLSEGVEITLADGADRVSADWFPHLKRGMEQGLAEAEQRGRRLVGVRVTVQKIHEHPVDTTAYGCERYGCSFTNALVWHRAVPVAEPGQAEPFATPDPAGL